MKNVRDLKLHFTKFLLITAISWIIITVVAAGCSSNSDGFFMGALGLGEGRILVANSVTNPIAQTVSMYDLDGNFISLVSDFSEPNILLRGLALADPFNVLISTDTPDSIYTLNLFNGEYSTWTNSGLLSGNIYEIVRQKSGTYFVSETSNIEKFVEGQRTPPSGNAYITTVVGACTISTARGLIMNSLGELIVVSFTNGRILRYDISTSTAACLASNTTVGANQPLSISSHPNGNIYIGSQTNDRIYVLPENFTAVDTATDLLGANADINNPTAIAVLPNGDLIVASDGIDTIVEVTPGGTVINSSFIKDAFTGTVTSILVIPPQ